MTIQNSRPLKTVHDPRPSRSKSDPRPSRKILVLVQGQNIIIEKEKAWQKYDYGNIFQSVFKTLIIGE